MYVVESHRTLPLPAVALDISLALRLMAFPYTVYSERVADPTQAHRSCPVVTPTTACMQRTGDMTRCLRCWPFLGPCSC